MFTNDIRSTTGTNDNSTSHVSIAARNAAGGHGEYFIVGVSGDVFFGAGANSYNVNPAGNNINAATTIRVHSGISANALNDGHRFGRNGDGSIMLLKTLQQQKMDLLYMKYHLLSQRRYKVPKTKLTLKMKMTTI